MSVVSHCLSSVPATMRHRFGLVLTVAAVMTLIGCGGPPSHGDRVPLEGTVTVAGEPLDVPATIYFDLPSGQTGTGSV